MLKEKKITQYEMPLEYNEECKARTNAKKTEARKFHIGNKTCIFNNKRDSLERNCDEQ